MYRLVPVPHIVLYGSYAGLCLVPSHVAIEMKRLTLIGLCITAIWIFLFSFIVLSNFPTDGQMSLNAWGDFLAGTTAPLALLWLVIGYFQQGEELHINTKVLEAQQRELQLQVQETANLAKNSERQARAAELLAQISKTEQEREHLQMIMDAQPEFVANGGSSSGARISTNIYNHGGLVKDISLEYAGPHDLDFSPTKRFDTGENGQITLTQQGDSSIQSINFQLAYTDRFGKRQSTAYVLNGHDLRLEIASET